MKHTYQIKIEYDGFKFVGWQNQKNGISVQEVVQKALRKLTKKNNITIYGSGRTDTGVHAHEQSAHFNLDHKIKNKINFIKSLNHFISKHSISILDMIKKNENFHARHSAVNRTYKYLIINRTSPLALNINRAWHIKKKLNIKQMQSGAKLLMGTKDFSTFRASSCSAKSPIKKLSLVKIKKVKEKVEITFTSKSFLQQQVRSMVGCLKYLGEGKWTVKEFNKALLSKKRFNCAPPAPPHGLYLYKIDY